MKHKILVTQPTLPPLKEFIPLLEEIWESKWITNNGKFHQELEKQLAEHRSTEGISRVKENRFNVRITPS